MASEPISNFPEEAPEPEIIFDEEQFSDTVSNKIRQADRYMEKGNYSKAIEWYKSCMEGIYADDEELNKKLLQAYFSNEDYLNTILLGEKLNNERFFQNSQEKIAYAWAYFELHDDLKAEQVFEEMNLSNTNYQHRAEYAKFLIESDQFDKARSLLAELENEIDHMDQFEKNLLSKYIIEIEAIHRTLSSSNK